MRFVLGLVIVAGCTQPPCETDAVVVDELGPLPTNVCDQGTLVHWPSSDGTGTVIDHAPFVAAHDCAVAAVQDLIPFMVSWTVAGVDTGTKLTLVGAGEPTTYRVRLYTEGYGVVGNFHAVDVQQCASLGDAGQCGDILDTLCLTCDGPSTNVCTSR